MKRVIVVAGSAREAELWRKARAVEPGQMIYASDESRLMGLRPEHIDRVVLTGQHWLARYEVKRWVDRIEAEGARVEPDHV